MKYLILPIFTLLLFSCGESRENHSGGDYSEISISMDTVIVDSGDEILMAATSSNGQFVNLDKTLLYFWDVQSSNLEVIELSALKLIEKKPFERDGPNSVGQYPYKTFIVKEDQIGFMEWGQLNIADIHGNVLQRIKLTDDWLRDKIDEKESLSVIGFSESGEIMYCGIQDFFSDLNSDIVHIDLANQTSKLIALPEYQKRENFRVTFKNESGGFMEIYASEPNLELTHHKGKVIFWSDAFNAIYEYDPKNDSLTYHRITNTLFANEKSGTYTNDVSSSEERTEMETKLNEEVKFTELFWDEKNEVFYRFCSYKLPRIADEKVKSKVFISIINEKFEVIGEKEITEIINSEPTAKFVKDGQIYSYLNIDDELGFVRMKIN